MKYMIKWKERSQGSAIEYEKAQQWTLDVFRQWETPANFKIELFVTRVGDWGGYLLADGDDPFNVDKFCSMAIKFVKCTSTRRIPADERRKEGIKTGVYI
jgi:hypothetical protein